MGSIRPCREGERATILAIVNAAAEAYRGVIPADRWREPYMPAQELDAEVAAGVAFWGYEADGSLIGVMGIQPVRDVVLIRHAYVEPQSQGRGVGGALLEHLMSATTQPVLVGTWAAAEWAIAFYRRHGFEPVGPDRTAELLRTYWTIPERQIETSVVLDRSSVGTRVLDPPSLGVGGQVGEEGQDHEEPLESRHVPSAAPVPEGGVGERGPREQEEAEQRDDPAVEGAAQDVAEEPHEEEGEPR